MDIDIVVFIIVSGLVIYDFAAVGLRVTSMAKQAKASERAFISGIGKLLLTVAFTHLFWLLVILFGPIFSLSDNPLARHGVTLIFVVMGLASVIGRRRWWAGTIAPALNGHYKKDDDEAT